MTRGTCDAKTQLEGKPRHLIINFSKNRIPVNILFTRGMRATDNRQSRFTAEVRSRDVNCAPGDRKMFRRAFMHIVAFSAHFRKVRLLLKKNKSSFVFPQVRALPGLKCRASATGRSCVERHLLLSRYLSMPIPALYRRMRERLYPPLPPCFQLSDRPISWPRLCPRRSNTR